MCVQRGGDPVHPGTPRGDVAAKRALLPSWRWGGCVLLWSDGGSGGFSSSFHPLDKHIRVVSPSLQPWCPLLCPRGGAHERQLFFFFFLIVSSSKTPWGVQQSHPSPSSRAWSEVAPAFALLPGTAIPSHLWSSQIYIYVFVSFQENWGQTYFLL